MGLLDNYLDPFLKGSIMPGSTFLSKTVLMHMGGCQNHGPFLSTLNIRYRIIIGIQKGTIILTTTHIRY